MIKVTIVALSMLMGVVPFGADLDATTGTQTITGTLSANLAITVSGTGNSNAGEDGGTDCNTNFWRTTAFTRGNIADSSCTYLTMTASSTAWEVEVDVTDNVECGFMYDDDASDDWGNDGGDTLLTDSGHNTATNCDATGDQANINNTSTGSSVFLFAEGIDISAGSGTGSDCNQIGVTTGAGVDAVEDILTLGTPNPLVSSAAFGEGLVPDGTATDLLKCTAPVNNAGMFVDVRVVVPNLALDGTYEMNLTYTIQNTP